MAMVALVVLRYPQVKERGKEGETGNEKERIVFHASILCPLLACVNISFAVSVI